MAGYKFLELYQLQRPFQAEPEAIMCLQVVLNRMYLSLLLFDDLSCKTVEFINRKDFFKEFLKFKKKKFRKFFFSKFFFENFFFKIIF